MLLGDICPLCLPNVNIHAIEPDILRNIKITNLKKPKSIPIYSISKESKICNFIDNDNCREVSCLCSQKYFTGNQYNIRGHTKDFWFKYKSNVNINFIHNVLYIPYAPNMSDNAPSEGDTTNTPQDSSLLIPEDLVKEYTMTDVDLFAFGIKNPPDTIFPHDYLSEFIDIILEFIRSSELVCNRLYDSFKIWIWAYSNFVKVNKVDLNIEKNEYHQKNLIL